MKKILKILILLIIMLIIIEKIPIKKAIKLTNKYTIMTNKSDNELFICREAHVTGPPWEIIGDKHGLNNTNRKNELVILEGNVPSDKLTTHVFVNADNSFIIAGKIIGESDFEVPNEKFKIINVEDWDIVYPIDRGDSLRILASKSSLSIIDFIWKK